MARGDVVIANSGYTAGLIGNAYPFAREHTAIIHRGTDLRRFARTAVDTARVQRMRKSWNVGPEDRVILLAARLTAWKGQKVLIEAARLLAERGITDVRYILVGDDQGRAGDARRGRRDVDALGRSVLDTRRKGDPELERRHRGLARVDEPLVPGPTARPHPLESGGRDDALLAGGVLVGRIGVQRVRERREPARPVPP